MPSKQFYHDIDLVKVGQLLNYRVHNVTDAEMTSLAGTLGVANKGLPVYNTDQSAVLYWDGAQFVQQAVAIDGDVIFRGVLLEADYDNADPSHRVKGSQYVIGEAGVLNFSTSTTYVPSANVEVGDKILFTDADEVYVFQKNDEQATEAALGNVRIADNAEALAGVNDTDAMTPAKVQHKLDQLNYTRGYFESIDTVLLTPYTITHNLGLVDKDAFTINLMDSTGSQVGADVDSIDANSLSITTFLAVSGLHVTITGIPA